MKRKSDCDIIMDDFGHLGNSLEKCFDTLADERKGKLKKVGSVMSVLGATGRLLWDGGSCAVKNTPKALATVASVKREVTETIVNEYQQYQKEVKQQELEERIRQLKINNKQ